MERLGAAVTRRAAVPLAAAAALVLLSFTGFARLEVDTDYLRFFDARSETRQAYELVQEKFGGVDTIQIVLEGDVLEPETLRAMEALQAELDGDAARQRFHVGGRHRERGGPGPQRRRPGLRGHPRHRGRRWPSTSCCSPCRGDAMLDQFLTWDQGTAKIEVPVATTSAQERAEVLRRDRRAGRREAGCLTGGWR